MYRRTARRLTAAAAACALGLSGGGFFPAAFPAAETAVLAAELPIADFSLSDVTVTDGYCVNAFSKEVDYLLSFDPERLLAGFRENAKLSTNGAQRYKGWEDTLIAGHTVGHYLTAAAQAFLNPSLTAAQRNGLSGQIDALLSGMRICQQNSKGKKGFLWAGQVKDPNNAEAQFDLVEQGKTNIINESWVPWYTMHKLIQGLVDVYKATGSETAKTVASELGDWTYARCRTWNQQTHNTVLSIEYGGMNDCLYELYAITGKDDHAVAAHYFDETALHEAVLKGSANVLNGRHANTTIPKFIGVLKRYTVLNGKTVAGERIDASRCLAYAEAFWDIVISHHTYITGGNSEWEHFGMDDVLDAERTNCNCETCNSYNMLKLSRELFKITGEKKYMDFYERTYYNSILSSQNPETGMTTYFQPMATGYFKVYSSPYDSFWCCTGSGMESFTKLGDTIYLHAGNTLWVNLYQSSVLDWQEQKVQITQESGIPAGDTVTFTVSGSAELDLRFRLPDWKAGSVGITVNGTPADYTVVSDYAQLSRSFSDGDVISLTIPEKVTAENLPDKPGVYGFRYGPVVLSAELGRQNMVTGSTGMWVTIPKDAVSPPQNITIAKEGQSVTAFMREIGEHLVRDGDALTFTLKDTDASLTFTPHYLQYQQRYGIYWNFLSNGTVIEEKPPRAEITVTDTVQPGYGQYENDEPHRMTEYHSKGVTDDSTYRYAEAGGYFSYQMKADKSAPLTQLSVRLRRADNGKTLRIRVGDAVLFAGTLRYAGTEDTYEMRLPVPAEVLRRCIKTVPADGIPCDVIDVTFSADEYAESAKVCDFIYMKAVWPDYEFDDSIAYFVDCGDQGTATASGSDRFGLFNCLTEQLYGTDEVSGRVWGLIDDPADPSGGASAGRGLYTANTWPDETAPADGRAKTASFRYTKNQYENGIARHLDYGFSLPDGEYLIETSFSDPWGCSKNPSLSAECGGAEEILIAENCPSDGTAVRGTVTVKGGQLTLHFRSDDKAINVNYIVIRFADRTAWYSTAGRRGDVNADDVCDEKDAGLLASALLAKTELTWEQAYAADLQTDFRLDARDLCLVRRLAGK